MDEFEKIVDWLWDFLVRWFKIGVTVICLATILVGSMMFGLGGMVLLKTLSFDVKAVEYVLVGLCSMIVCLSLFIERGLVSGCSSLDGFQKKALSAKLYSR